MSKIECSARGIECDCRADECRSAPAHIFISKRPPLIGFTPVEKWTAAIIFAVVVSLNILAIAHAMTVSTDQAKIHQELTWTK